MPGQLGRQAEQQSPRWRGQIRILAVLTIVACIVLVARLLPVTQLTKELADFVQGLGAWGIVIFAGCYVIATVLMVPGSAITLVAGAVFGLLWGTVAVSAGATVGAACAFLIARHVARPTVERQLARSTKFKAIDRAINDGGWKIVALLRLSPAIPFNLQNYLYGLTAIRFWPCVLTSAIAMLPGTFMYIYLGYAGGTSLAAAAGTERERTLAEWTMLGLGLLATVLVTVYVTRLASKALKEQTALAADSDKAGPAEVANNGTAQRTTSGRLLTASLVILAGIAITATAYAYVNPAQVRSLFGVSDAARRETQTQMIYDESELNSLEHLH